MDLYDWLKVWCNVTCNCFLTNEGHSEEAEAEALAEALALSARDLQREEQRLKADDELLQRILQLSLVEKWKKKTFLLVLLILFASPLP